MNTNHLQTEFKKAITGKKRTIAARYFNELRNGDTVPRNEKTGETLSFLVSMNYVIVNADTKEEILARCTQNCPCNLRFIQVLK